MPQDIAFSPHEAHSAHPQVGGPGRSEPETIPAETATVRTVPLRPPFRHSGGFCWEADLPDFLLSEGDDPTQKRRSTARLLEDGSPIGSPHSLHEHIREIGLGAYSHWRDTLYFATSDNSDPNANERSYELRLHMGEAEARPDGVAPVRLAADAGVLGLADILLRREVREVAYFHTDHFEPWGNRSNEQRWRGLERFADETRRSRYGRQLSLFYTPWLVHALGVPGSKDGVGVVGDAVVFRRRAPEFVESCRTFVRPLEAEIGHEFHIHLHHEGWTRTQTNYGPVSAWVNEHSTAEADSRRLDFFIGLSRVVMSEEIGRPFDSWGFVHGNWSLNASEPRSCRVEDEISVLSQHGCYGDFTFPAGNPRCNPTILEFPYSCQPTVGVKSYDLPSADPRPLASNARLIGDGRFLIWNSPIKATHSSLDYFSEDNCALYREPEALVRSWLEDSVVIDHCLYVKTHAHSLHYKYEGWKDENPPPHTYPDIVAVFELLERVCDTAAVPFELLTVEQVMGRLRRFDSGEVGADRGMTGEPAVAAASRPAPDADDVLARVVPALSAAMRDIAGGALGPTPIDSYYASRVGRDAVLESYERVVVDYAREHLPATEHRVFEVGIGWGMLSICLAAMDYEVFGFVGQRDHAEAARFLQSRAAEIVPEIRDRLKIVQGLFPDALEPAMFGGGKRNLMLSTNLVHSFSAENQDRILEAGRRFDTVVMDTGTFGVNRDGEARTRLRSDLEARFEIEETLWQGRMLVMRPRGGAIGSEADAGRQAQIAAAPSTTAQREPAMPASQVTYPLKGPFTSNGGHAWIARLPFEFEDDADIREQPRRSQWRLLENGVPLDVPHAVHSDIQDLGRGRHSHWATQLYFSASDNSDPNANGRVYALQWEGGGTKPWLTARAAAPIAQEMPFGERPDVQGCSGVIAIFGASFCGSTLVNSVLGAHPLILGGGELHWLVEDPSGTVCAICRSACRFWTPEVRAAIRVDQIYHQASRRFGRPFVVDISKMRDWYAKVLPHFAAVPSARVLVVKHPVRHVASFVEKSKEMPEYADPVNALRRLRAFYEGFALPGEEANAAPHGADRMPVDFVLRYEEFVASPAAALQPILQRLGLDYHPRMDFWASAEHHHIGGNVGPRVQINNDVPVLPTAVRKYRRRGIFLDNSFAEILDLDAIERVLLDPDAIWIRQRFGYPVAARAAAAAVSAAGPTTPQPTGQDEARETVPLRPPFVHGGGVCWSTVLPPPLVEDADDPLHKYRSPWRLLEDGQPIGEPHAAHDDIRTRGAGRHSHWKEVLYFSASDNTDPNTNGHEYQLARSPAGIRSTHPATAPAATKVGGAPAKLVDILRQRDVHEVVYFHTDHFEPWGGDVDQGLATLERFAALTRRSRYGRHLSLFYTPPIHYFLDRGGAGPDTGDRVPGDMIVFEQRTPAEIERYRNAVEPLSELGHEFHLHVHHTRWTRTVGNDFGALSAWLDQHSTPEADSARLDLFIRLSCEEIAAETGRPFRDWAFIHGLWALNGSDATACQVRDEIALLMRHGCFGDFTFPAGRKICDPVLCEVPYTCLPIVADKAYDLPAAEPRPVVRGSRCLKDDRFFIWNSPIKSQHCSLDYYWEPNVVLFRTPEVLVTEWLEHSVLLDGSLYIKTHSHSLDPSYRIAAGEGGNPHSHPDVVGVLELLERTCETARVPLEFATVNEVMARLRRLDRGEGEIAASAQQAVAG